MMSRVRHCHESTVTTPSQAGCAVGLERGPGHSGGGPPGGGVTAARGSGGVGRRCRPLAAHYPRRGPGPRRPPLTHAESPDIHLRQELEGCSVAGAWTDRARTGLGVVARHGHWRRRKPSWRVSGADSGRTRNAASGPAAAAQRKAGGRRPQASPSRRRSSRSALAAPGGNVRKVWFGIASNTLVRSSQSSSGPAGGASDG